MSDDSKDWNPGAYDRFRGLRLRPALDLLAQVGALPPGDVVDLGCGSGAAGPALHERFPGRRIIGLDASPAMLDRAGETACYDRLDQTDISVWSPASAPALIFFNAALQWLDGHETLLPRLAGMLAPAGWLAVQMPRQHGAASHTLLHDVATALFPDRFATPPLPRVHPPEVYFDLLSGTGALALWETDYLQHLPPQPEGHPVRHFTASTAMRPILDCLSDAEAARFVAAYDAALHVPYPLRPDGSALFPFRRIFLIVKV